MKKFLIITLMFVAAEAFVMWKSEAEAAVTFNQAKKVFAILEKTTGYKAHLCYDCDLNSNAYATVSGICINQGMLNDLRTDDQLAMVLGHELGHYVMGDPMHKNAARFELRADKIGYAFCRKAGYKQCLSFMYLMMSLYGDESDDVHPKWSYRIKQLKRGG